EIRPEPILLVAPRLHVATGAAYQALRRGLTDADSSSKINGFQAFVRSLAGERSARAAGSFSANDFEAVVFRQYPQLQIIERKLSKLGASVRMTGSGSSIFGVFGSRKERDRAAAVLKGDRVFGKYLVMPGTLVSRRSYQQLWRRQLSQHIRQDRSRADQSLWPPQSRYAR